MYLLVDLDVDKHRADDSDASWTPLYGHEIGGSELGIEKQKSDHLDDEDDDARFEGDVKLNRCAALGHISANCKVIHIATEG